MKIYCRRDGGIFYYWNIYLTFCGVRSSSLCQRWLAPEFICTLQTSPNSSTVPNSYLLILSFPCTLDALSVCNCLGREQHLSRPSDSHRKTSQILKDKGNFIVREGNLLIQTSHFGAKIFAIFRYFSSVVTNVLLYEPILYPNIPLLRISLRI